VVQLGAVSVLYGVAFVGVAMIVAVLGGGHQRLLLRLRRADRPRLDELLNAAASSREVLVTGRVVPGPDGVVASPAYGSWCAWYRTTVSSRGGEGASITHVDLGAGGPTLGLADDTGTVGLELGLVLRPGSHDRIHHTRTEQGSLRRGASLPEGSGLAALERNGLLPASVYPRFGSRSVHLSETTIAAGTQVSVLARFRRQQSGVVLLTRRGVVSAELPQDWIARIERDAVTALRMTLVFPVIGAALLVVGVALLWVGAT
jgi:hypothetical protein